MKSYEKEIGNMIDGGKIGKSGEFEPPVKMKRQGLRTTVFELRTLADELEAQCRLLNLELDVVENNEHSKFQLNIINKSGASDTWEFEKSP